MLRDHLPEHDPLAGYAERLDDANLRQSLRGYLTGSIDLVVRADDRFAVVDYKTNWLGAPGEELTAWHHRPAALATEMQHAHYALQALLYTAALHRYLRWRLPGYDPERNLAGVLYLFLRGMVGPDTPAVDGTPRRRLRLAPAERARRGAQRRARPGRRRVSLAETDLFDVRRATSATGLLHDFNAAGVLDAADVHVARRLAALAGDDDEQVALAAALAVRGPRLGHVYVDLATIRETATVDAEEAVDLSALAWPAVGAWIERLAGERPRRRRGRGWSEPAAAPRRHLAVPRPLLARGAPDRRRPPGARRRGARGRRRGRAGRRPRAALPRRRRRAPARGRRGRGPPPLRRRRRRPGHGQDDDRRAHRRAAGRAGRGGRPAPAAHRARGAHGRRRGAPGGGRPRRRRGARRQRRRPRAAAATRAPRPCTACSAGAPTARAASATIAATACPTTS